MHTVGAGGGSIAWRDAGGALRVGPRSAGADPGPAAYGRGGEEPTVTDANLVLGYLDASSPLAGGVDLDADAAHAAVEGLGGELGLSVEKTAAGIVRVASAEMARAVRVMTVERGVDPRDLALLAFGGAGPLHAASIAAELDMNRVLVPPSSGVLSAVGLVASEPRRDLVESVLLSGGTFTSDAAAQWTFDADAATGKASAAKTGWITHDTGRIQSFRNVVQGFEHHLTSRANGPVSVAQMLVGPILDRPGAFDRAGVMDHEIRPQAGEALRFHLLTILEEMVGDVARHPETGKQRDRRGFRSLLVREGNLMPEPQLIAVMVGVIDRNVPLDEIAKFVAGHRRRVGQDVIANPHVVLVFPYLAHRVDADPEVRVFSLDGGRGGASVQDLAHAVLATSVRG